jgi:hypothetical protein
MLKETQLEPSCASWPTRAWMVSRIVFDIWASTG